MPHKLSFIVQEVIGGLLIILKENVRVVCTAVNYKRS